MKYAFSHADIALAGLFLTAAILTGFTFNFFSAGDYGLGYNYYFLALLDGRLDVPLEIIGEEAFYADDGRAFMYYGALPALLRIFFWPFVDLETVPVSAAVVFMMLAAAGLLAHHLLVLLHRHSPAMDVRTSHERAAWIRYGIIALWFASPVLILMMNASIYHEPIAAAFLITICFLYIVFRSVLLKGRISLSALFMLALLAALTVHARPHVALGLYMCVCLISLLMFIEDFKACRQKNTGALLSLIKAALPFVLPMAIMLASGFLYLYMNWLRWGDFTSVAPIERYGAFLNGEGYSKRIQGFLDHGAFSVNRIIPNFVFHLFGALTPAIVLQEFFNTGFIRKEGPPGPVFVIWVFWILGAGLSVWSVTAAKTNLKISGENPICILGLTMAVIAVFVLAYATTTFRYKTELWFLLFFAFCIFILRFNDLSRKVGYERLRERRGPGFVMLVISVFSSIICCIIYYHTRFRNFVIPPTEDLQALQNSLGL